MTKKLIAAALIICSAFTTANAGGMLTNTNQNVSFLRNPARDGAIGIDGVYANPAGVAFMPEGFHLALGWQAAFQTRTIKTTNPLLQMGVKNNLQATKEYEGKSTAPFIPSVQAAYNKGKWSFQFNFAITGGGGKCEFADGIGSFESAVGKIAYGLQQFGSTASALMGYPAANIAQAYDASCYMQGKQYYFGFTLGTAYKVTENLSLYAGVRALYGSAAYKAKIDQIKVYTSNPNKPIVDIKEYYYGSDEFIGIQPYLKQASVLPLPEEKKAMVQQLQAIEPYAANDGVNLKSDQSAFGIAPIIGADFKYKQFNFAVKYEFRTKMNMTNNSDVKTAHAIDAVNQFRDGTDVREDQPSLLTFGLQYTPIDLLRFNFGYHHFYDTHAKKYNDRQKLLSKGTDEYLCGAEIDLTKKLTISGGLQFTNYGNTDEFINDMSYVVNSWSYGVGAKYQVSDKVAINAAYFKTKYGDYNQDTPDSNGSINEYTRSNRVGAIGVEINF